MRCHHVSVGFSALALLVAWAAFVAPALAIDSTWNADADGNWSDAAKWTAGVPNAIGDIARLTYNITAARTVTIDASSRTIGSLYLSDDNYGWTLAGIGLNLDVSSGSALIQSDGGTGFTHLISAPVSLYDGTTVAVNSGMLQVSGAISSAVAGKGIAKSGAGTLILGATNTYTGITTISGGALQALDGTSLPSASFLSFDGGVLESWGTFTRPVGTGGRAFQWNYNGGGFSAAGGPLTVNIGGSATPTELVCATTLGSGTLKFGSATANNQTELTNGIDLYAGTRTIDVAAGLGGDSALLSGVIRNSIGTAGITKTGAGILTLTGTNTYNGPTTVSEGVLQAAEGTALPAASALTFKGGVLQASGTITRPLGTAAGAVQWTGAGGFSAQGGKLTVAIGGTANPTPLTWAFREFVPAKSTLIFGSPTADSEIEFTNNITFANDLYSNFKIVVNDNPASSGDFATLSGVVSGYGFYKFGMGTLVLKGANTYTNTVSVYGGTLRLGSNQAIPSGSTLNILNGSTVDMAGYTMSPQSVTVNDGTLMGAGSVITAGVVRPQKGQVLAQLAGTVCVDKETDDTGILTCVNTYTGWTDIYGGTLRANDGVGLSPTSTVYFGSGVLEITGGGTFTRSIGKGPGQVWWWPTSGRGGFAALGGKVTVAIGGLATPTNLVQGSGQGFEDLRFGSPTADSEVEFRNNVDLGNDHFYVTVIDNPGLTGDLATMSGNLTNGYLEKMGTGTLVLSGKNNFGMTDVEAGTLRLGSSQALGSTGNVYVDQGATLDVGAYQNAVGPLTLRGGQIVGNGSLISAASFSLESGTISASLGGTGGLRKWDARYSVLLGGANTYSGVTTVMGGVLVIDSDRAIPAGGTIIVTYDLNGGTGTLYIGHCNVTAGTVTLADGTISGSTGVLSTTNLDASKGTITASLGGAGTFTKTTNDIVTLGGANTFTGPTIVSGGTLRLVTNNAIPSGGNVTVQGGILDIGAYGPNAGTVSLLDGAITGSTGVLNAATLDLRKGTVSAILGGSTGPSKSTADTVALTAANAYSGPTIVYGGALQAVSGIGLPSASNLVLAGGVLEGIGATTFTRTPGASGANTVRWTGSGGFSASGGKMTVAIGGTASPTALTWASDSFVPSGSALLFGSTTADNETEFRNNINLGGVARTVLVNDNPSVTTDFATLSGILSNGSLIKDGPGTLALSGANTFAGGVTVTGGTLRLATASALTSGSSLTAQGGTLDIGPYNVAAGAVTLVDGAITGTTGILTGSGYDVRKGTVNATLGGSVALAKTTPDTATLAGANIYTGVTTVSGGSLRATSGTGLPAASNLVLAGGVLEGIGATTFTRNLGTSWSNTVQWTGSGGFAASGGKMTVAIGGTASPTALTWGTGSFVPSGSALLLGSLTADSETDFRNDVNLAAGVRTVSINDNSLVTTDFATLSGILSNGSLVKDGIGMLMLSGTNAYAGTTTVKAGALRATSGIGLPAASNLILAGGVLEGVGVTTFSRTLGTSGTNTVQWTGSGGFSASGGKMTVAIGGTASPTPLTWGSGNFVPSGSALVFGSPTADNETEFGNRINLAGAVRNVTINDNPFSAGDFATLSGALSNGGLTKDGMGLLVLKGSHTYTGSTTVAAGTLKLPAGATLASTTFDVAAPATLDVTDLGSFALGASKTLKGGGTVLGNLSVSGTVAPGESPGVLNVGSVTFSSGGKLQIELGGTTAGTQYDRLQVAGFAGLGGTLAVSLINGFRPSHNDAFTVLTCGSRSSTFGSTTGLDLGGRLTLAPSYASTAVTLTAVQGGSGTWRYDAGGTVGVPANWAGGVPNGVGDIATLGPVTTVPRTVTVDAPLTLGGLTFTSSVPYTVEGPGVVRLEGAGSADATLDVASGSHAISASLLVAGNLDISEVFGTLALEGALDNTGGMAITKTGAGALTISGPQTHGPGALLNVLDGAVYLNSDAGTSAANLSVFVTDAELYFGSNQHLDTLSIGDGGEVVFAGAHVVMLQHLVMDGMDLGPTVWTPEPATLALLGLGGLWVLVRRRRT
jgi:autotransporter-associated beta strand protein